jgi:hypothetical protein
MNEHPRTVTHPMSKHHATNHEYQICKLFNMLQTIFDDTERLCKETFQGIWVIFFSYYGCNGTKLPDQMDTACALAREQTLPILIKNWTSWILTEILARSHHCRPLFLGEELCGPLHYLDRYRMR